MALGVAEGKTARMNVSMKSLRAAGKDSHFLFSNPFFPCFQAIGN